jgi:negative regulator of replication initiation
MTYKNRRISGFTFLGQNKPVENWKGLLVGICEILYRRHPKEFQKKVVPIHGSKRIYFSQEPDKVRMQEPLPIPGSSIFVETKMDADAIYKLCLDALKALGYKEKDLQIHLD